MTAGGSIITFLATMLELSQKSLCFVHFLLGFCFCLGVDRFMRFTPGWNRCSLHNMCAAEKTDVQNETEGTLISWLVFLRFESIEANILFQ